MARMQPELRKRIIAIACRQFLEQGYEKTSIRSMTERRKAKSVFISPFTSKEEIFNTVLEQYNMRTRKNRA
jgi:AcrR family transcriptional regulator